MGLDVLVDDATRWRLPKNGLLQDECYPHNGQSTKVPWRQQYFATKDIAPLYCVVHYVWRNSDDRSKSELAGCPGQTRQVSHNRVAVCHRATSFL
jgi:hypothetical protein